MEHNIAIISNFELTILTNLYNNSDMIATDNNKRDLNACKEYMLQRIYPLENSKLTCVYSNNKLIVMNKEIFTRQYFNRFPCKELKTWYLKRPNINYFKLCCEKKNITPSKPKEELEDLEAEFQRLFF